jgi:hypothetical protein
VGSGGRNAATDPCCNSAFNAYHTTMAAFRVRIHMMVTFQRRHHRLRHHSSVIHSDQQTLAC